MPPPPDNNHIGFHSATLPHHNSFNSRPTSTNKSPKALLGVKRRNAQTVREEALREKLPPLTKINDDGSHSPMNHHGENE